MTSSCYCVSDFVQWFGFTLAQSAFVPLHAKKSRCLLHHETNECTSKHFLKLKLEMICLELESVPHPADGPDQFWNDMQVVLQRDYDLDDNGFSRSVCTATYFDRCMPLNECRWSCGRMGANSFRWFHNGCCECAGPTCFNYGNRFLKCSECMQ